MTASPVWKVALVVPAKAGEAVAVAIEPFVAALSMFETPDRRNVELTGFSADEPDRAAIAAATGEAGAALGLAAPPVDIVWLPAVDWVAENQASFAPIRAARFFIHDSYHLEPPPPATIPIRIDAATAFGTGRHGTTRGCLEALDRIGTARGRAACMPALDLGCGTGVLAIAAAKWRHLPVVASDIDREAVAMARENARVNGVAGLVRVHCSAGLDMAALRRPGPYRLILANILARPLARLAPAIARALAPGGTAVLSGILTHQEPQVLSAYRAQGLHLADRIRHEEWLTLTVR